MSWNYRVIRRVVSGEEFFGIHTGWYNDDKIIDGIGETPQCPGGNTVEELKEELQRFLDACEKPVLKYDDF